MRHLWRRWRAMIAQPVLADRGLDFMCGSLWALYGLWGVVSTVARIPTLDRTAPPLYQLAWGGGIGVIAIIASVAAFSTLVPASVRVRIRKKQIERWSVCLLAGLIGVYPVLVTLEALSGDLRRQALAILTWSFVVVPTWRVLHLVARIRGLRRQLGPRRDGIPRV